MLARTLLVKNEIDIIQYNLEHHKGMFDITIVTDNGSTDGTREILQEYHKNGVIDIIIDEPDTTYNQKDWVNKMIFTAKALGATYVFNSDADEFLIDDNIICDFKNLLINLYDYNAIYIPFYNYIPEDNKHFTEFSYRTTDTEYLDNKLSKHYSLFAPVNANPVNKYKVVHIVKGFDSIYQGNHSVKFHPNVPINEFIFHGLSLHIAHYPIRSYEQFKNKILQGGKAYEGIANKGLGSHWRKLYDILIKDELLFKKEYDKIICKHINMQDLVEDNIIRKAKVF